MSYETKVILIALAEIISSTDNVEDVYEAVARMANAEGVVLEPLEELRKKRNKSKETRRNKSAGY